MDIKSISPLQSSGNYFINDDNFSGELFFTDVEKNISFIIVKYDYDILKWKVVYNGILSGYSNNVNYDYRINIEKFINIETYRDFNLQIYNLDFGGYTIDEKVQYMNVEKQTSQLSIILNNTQDILTTYSNLITIQNNGEIYLNSGPNSFLTENTVLNYLFINKKNNNYHSYSLSKFAVAGTWFPFTTFNVSSEKINLKVYDENENILILSNLYTSTKGIGRLFMIYIPLNATKILFTNLLNNETKEYKVHKICSKPYFYWGSDGIDVVYLSGNQHIVENTTKEYINLGNKKYPIKIETTKQIKRNTGFNLIEEQVFDLLKTTYINEIYDGEIEQSDRNLFDGSTSPDWTHIDNQNYSTNNIITNDGEQYNRVIPTSGNKINIKGIYKDYKKDIFYIASCWVRQKSGSSITYRIFESREIEPYNEFTILNDTWTRIYTRAFAGIDNDYGRYVIIQQQGDLLNIPLEIKNIQVEYEIENYILYEKEYGYMYKLEKDGIPSIYKQSLLDSGKLTVKNKLWLLDTSNFEGYNGSLYSEKNIELLLTDEKTYKKYLNIKQNFYD